MVWATIVTPAEAGPRPRYVWVRVEEGDNAGQNERVPREDLEAA